MKRFLQGTALAAIALSLTGCVKMTMDLTVNPNDTVSGQVIYAVSKALTSLGASSTDIPKTDTLFPRQAGVATTAYDDGTFVGSKFTFTNVPLQRFAPTSQNDASLAIHRQGEDIIVSGNVDLRSTDTSTDAFTSSMVKALTSTMVLRVSITLPGTIVSTNGRRSGQTINWILDPMVNNVISARAHAPLPTSGPIPPVIVGSMALFAALVVVGWLTMQRRRRSGTAVESLTVPEATE